MSYLLLFLFIGLVYAASIVLIWKLARTISVEYALWFGPVIDTPNLRVSIGRLILVFLILVLTPEQLIIPVLLSCIIYSLLLVLIFSRFWLVSWISYVLQFLAIAIVIYAGVSVVNICITLVLLIISDYIASRPINSRYDRYVLRTHRYLAWRFGKNICSLNAPQQSTLYAIMIAENMNRPIGLRVVEWVAKLTYYRNTSLSTGIMQVNSPMLLSDTKSILLAAKMIRFCDMFLQIKGNCNTVQRANKVALYYNGSNYYVNHFFVDIYELIT